MARVKDLWFTAGKRGPRRKTRHHPDNGGAKDGKRWLAVWQVGNREATKAFAVKAVAASYASAQETDVARGQYLDPKRAKITVAEWCDTWLTGYHTRPSTIRQAKIHIRLIKAQFGNRTVASVQPSHVKAWMAKLARDGYAASTVYALHSRLSQLMHDAVADGLRGISPCSRKTSPPRGRQRPFLATTEQVWALHAATPVRWQPAILLGAFAGLRAAEACGLRIGDVDFALGLVAPAVQHPAEPLKSEMSRTAVPVPASMTSDLLAHVAQFPGDWVLTMPDGGQVGPWTLERVIRDARGKVPGLPATFRFHDLRHYFASLLIASGADVKKVQARLRHASAKTTLDTYGHLWPDSDESTRSAVDAVFEARTEQSRNQQPTG